MAPVVYTRDADTVDRMMRLERRLTRLECGYLGPGVSVQVRAAQALTGPWPVSTSFAVTNTGSTVLVVWQTSAYTTVGGLTTVNLNVDAVLKDSSTQYFNSTNFHMPFPMGLVSIVGLAAGNHTAQVALASGTSDANDHGHILILELP